MVIMCGLFEAGCNTSELLEFWESAFDEIALSIEMLVERIFERT